MHNVIPDIAPVRERGEVASVEGLFVDACSNAHTDEALGVAAVGLQ